LERPSIHRKRTADVERSEAEAVSDASPPLPAIYRHDQLMLGEAQLKLRAGSPNVFFRSGFQRS